MAGNGSDEKTFEMVPLVTFVPWAEAGLDLKEHVVDWHDENLEPAMRKITGITNWYIMLSECGS